MGSRWEERESSDLADGRLRPAFYVWLMVGLAVLALVLAML